MKALWVCNLVLPEFASEFDLNKSVLEGWITGMLHQMETKAEIAFCFPIMDSWRAKDGELNGHKYYSFQYSACEYYDVVRKRFIEIIKDYKPDIIHIWGTEFPHTLAMVNACEAMGLLDITVIHIQGLIEPCSFYYSKDMLDDYLNKENEIGETIGKAQKEFEVRGRFENAALCKIKHVIGRTDWDYAWVKHVNNNIIYHFGGEVLRDEFYGIEKHWAYDTCEKYTIFVSQAGYAIKGLDYLLRAVPDVQNDYPDMHIYVAGTNRLLPDKMTGHMTPYGIYLKDIIEELNIQDKVTFLGPINAKHMIENYFRANVFVSCSRIENSPNSVCEAAMVGTPIVASYVGGMKNLAQKISNIELYQPGAEYMLAFYIKKFFAKREFDKSSDKIFKFVDKKNNMERTWQIYQEIRK